MDGLSWYVVLPAAIAYVITPVIAFVFFGCFCRARIKWFPCAVYVALHTGLLWAESRFCIKGCAALVLEILFLAGMGRTAFGRRWQEVLAAAALTQSVLSVAGGIISWTGSRVLLPVILAHENLVYPSDGAREFLKAAGVLALFSCILKLFRKTMEEAERRTLIWMTVPVFFISVVERVIQDSIYGDSLLVNTATGEYGSVIEIRHGEMLFLQVFAGLCLFLVLFACEKQVKIFQEVQKMRLLEQQAKVQEIYVQEAAQRYQRTCSFRHDIKNHLAVLSRLLENNQAEEAGRYLADLGEAAAGLSWQAQTGNTAVDALLGSKLSAASQKGIRITSQIRIPDSGGVRDLDWCILLSNGLDNAIKACRDVEEEKRYVKVESKRKGNFYLILMENSCDENMRQVPGDGTGLSNIRAVMEKYGGRAENEVSEGVYKLKLLFVDV